MQTPCTTAEAAPALLLVTDPEPWLERDFLTTAHAWIDTRIEALGLQRTGEFEQPHVQPWSTVLRAPTTRGPVWFKAVTDQLRHEAAVHQLIAARCPDRVPPLLAWDPETGWMLMADAGQRLREVVEAEHSLARWHDVLGATAHIQLAMTEDVPALLATGLPHYRLESLADEYAGFVADIDVEQRFVDAREQVAEMAAELASYGIAESVQHDDLHDGQVFVKNGTHLILDWGDACVSHPFFTLAVTLLGQLAWGLHDEPSSEDTAPYRDHYLAPFAAAYDVDVADLAPAADLGARLGWACRAVNGHVPGEHAATHTRLRMFLDGVV